MCINFERRQRYGGYEEPPLSLWKKEIRLSAKRDRVSIKVQIYDMNIFEDPPGSWK